MNTSCKRGLGVVLSCSSSSTSSCSFASTSRYTLDHHQPPLFQQLYPPHSSGTRSRRRRGSNQSILVKRLESINNDYSLEPQPPLPLVRSEVSPYLPQITREKNYLLSLLKSSLKQATTTSRRRKLVSTIEQSWLKFVEIWRYQPQSQLPIFGLPRSHFPTSTRSSSNTTNTTNEASGSIELSLKELHELFTIFSKSRPRTRTGLHRLLILTELISRHQPTSSLSSLSEPGVEVEEEEEQGLITPPTTTTSSTSELKGKGKGLYPKEWQQLLSFVGKSIRSIEPDPEIKSVLSIYSQYQSTTRLSSPSRKKEETTRIYNTLLDLAQRSKMNELFDEILEKMLIIENNNIEPDGATFVIRMKREYDRGGDLLRIFKQGLQWIDNQQVVAGKRSKRLLEENRKVLWNVLVTSLARRGKFELVEKIYTAMKNQQELEQEDEEFVGVGKPPLPDFKLYSSLIQSYSHYGHFKKSLLIFYEMIDLGSFNPTPQHFHHFFRAFFRFGKSPSHSHSHSHDDELDWVSLRGIKYDLHHHHHRDKSSSSPLSTVLSQSSSSSSSSLSSSRPRTRNQHHETVVEENDYNLKTFKTIFESFLSIQPPLPPPGRGVGGVTEVSSFEGERSSPKPQTIFFLLKSLQKLGLNDPKNLLEIYQRVENKFTNKSSLLQQGGKSERKWKGWKMDKRVLKIVKDLKDTVEENEKRLKELM
ncbi:hypothetical protein JCM3765_006476 [Sporobolomyces pararoseus]